jgi:hypothetical protein
MKLILITLFVINCLNTFVSSQEDDEKHDYFNATAAIESRSSTDEIYFDVTDLAVSYNNQNGDVYQLEAYKTSVNDKIIKDAATGQYNQLSWVSIGHPRIVKTNYASSQSDVESKLFYFNNEGFYTYVSMLTDEHKQLFVNAVQQKYNVNINTHQIRIMPLEIFNCNIKINWEGNITNIFIINYQ